MNYVNLLKRAKKEVTLESMLYLIEEVKEQIKEFPEGSRFLAGATRIQALADELDRLSIPCYIVSNSYLAVASSYLLLADSLQNK
jgi:hypothetical protein